MPPCFSISFAKGNNFTNFLFAVLDDKTLSNGPSLESKNLLKFVPLRDNSH